MNALQNDSRSRDLARSSKSVCDYNEFHRKFSDAFSKLIRLECECRCLGSTGPVMIAERNFRKALEVVTFLFASNLVVVYPEETEVFKSMHSLVKPEGVVEVSKDYGSKVENYTSAFESLAMSCSKLRTELYGFVGVYYNDGLMRVLADLDFHLKFYTDELAKLKESRQTVDLMSMRQPIRYVFKHLEEIMPILAENISQYVDVGIPLMRVKQKEFTWQYMNMTTIAIFFAGLTVAMLQYTFESTTSGIAITVNTLLFLSLVFSIASGALNLLVLAWRHSYVRSPEAMSNRWQSVCILSSPIACLLLAGTQFIVALCLFVFSSKQDRDGTSIVVTALVGVLAVFIVGLLAMFARHQLKFRETANKAGLSLTNSMLHEELAKWMVASHGDTTVSYTTSHAAGTAGRNVSPLTSRSSTMRGSISMESVKGCPSQQNPSSSSSRLPTPGQQQTNTSNTNLSPQRPRSSASISNDDADTARNPQRQPVQEQQHTITAVPADNAEHLDVSNWDADPVPVNEKKVPALSSNNAYPKTPSELEAGTGEK